MKLIVKKYQFRKNTPSDPFDEHVHEAAFDENGDGGTNQAGNPPHSHSVYGFRVMPFYNHNMETGESYSSVHPGSMAVGKEFSDLGVIEEMEFFRTGVHNGDEYTEDDLKTIVENFSRLKDEIRPKLKITHKDHQKTLAGLASYGDIVDVYFKGDDRKRIYAMIEKVPKKVMEWIRDGRFPERSMEIYPSFKLGTDEDSPIYKNVLKAIALLGSEMPAVPGMEPVKLKEFYESQKTVCVGDMCFECEHDAVEYLQGLARAAEISASAAELKLKMS